MCYIIFYIQCRVSWSCSILTFIFAVERLYLCVTCKIEAVEQKLGEINSTEFSANTPAS